MAYVKMCFHYGFGDMTKMDDHLGLTSENPFLQFQRKRRLHWDEVARSLDQWKGWGRPYHGRLSRIYQNLVMPGLRVLEIGCGFGDLLADLKPGYGVGIDLSYEMITRAKLRHPELHLIQAEAHNLPFELEFDVVIFSDIFNELWNVQAVLEQLQHLVSPQTRIIINTYSRLWELPLAFAQRMGLAKPNLAQNWLTVEDIENLLFLANFEVIKAWQEILLPAGIPLLSYLCNRILAKLWPFKYFGLTNLIVARPNPQNRTSKPLVSVIVPARNEAGNIESIFKRTPHMGQGTELVFVEGHSLDNTYEVIEKTIAEHPEFQCELLRQDGEGKGNAVRLGFERAKGDILMILDADLSVPPEELPRFYEALQTGKGEFINGVRLVYPMEDEAMRFLNLVGNKFFSLSFSWLLGQAIKDTLCGTKALLKSDYELISANRHYFGEFDPFGDFDLLFGAAKQNMKIVEVPIRYRSRTYGETNIDRWKHGFLLLRMVLFALKRMKFV
jgi:SAM-dependent methyltransferase